MAAAFESVSALVIKIIDDTLSRKAIFYTVPNVTRVLRFITVCQSINIAEPFFLAYLRHSSPLKYS